MQNARTSLFANPNAAAHQTQASDKENDDKDTKDQVSTADADIGCPENAETEGIDHVKNRIGQRH